MLRLSHKRITIQSSPLKDYQSLSHTELLLTTEYVTQRAMAFILGRSQGLSPQKNNDQYLSNVCLIVDVCFHRGTMISILLMSVLKVSVCLRSRVGDYDSMYVSMKRTVFKCLTNVFVKTDAKLGSMNPKLMIK